MRHQKAFTLIELLVVVAIIAVLIGILLPSLATARESARRAACGMNLSSISKACITYSYNNNNLFPAFMGPSTSLDPDTSLGHWQAHGGQNYSADLNATIYACYNPEVMERGLYNAQGNPLNNMWLLVMTGYCQSKSFICQSDPDSPRPAELDVSFISDPPITACSFGNLNVAGTKTRNYTCSYAFAYPWNSNTTENDHRSLTWWRNNGNSEQVIGADSGPLFDATKDPKFTQTSPNHGGKGQVVVYADGHAVFAKTNNAGYRGDNIYTLCNNSVYIQANLTKIGKKAFRQYLSNTVNPIESGGIPGWQADDGQDIILGPAHQN